MVGSWLDPARHVCRADHRGAALHLHGPREPQRAAEAAGALQQGPGAAVEAPSCTAADARLDAHRRVGLMEFWWSSLGLKWLVMVNDAGYIMLN